MEREGVGPLFSLVYQQSWVLNGKLANSSEQPQSTARGERATMGQFEMIYCVTDSGLIVAFVTKKRHIMNRFFMFGIIDSFKARLTAWKSRLDVVFNF